MRVPEEYRVTAGQMASDSSYGNNGAFRVPFKGKTLNVIASDGMGWNHVSVSLRNRTPTWEEMEYVKSLFFGPKETVVQYHVPRDRHVNIHKHCLHLWQPQNESIPVPPLSLV